MSNCGKNIDHRYNTVMSPVWREPFRVRIYEAEPSGRASVGALCRYFQEAADNHCRPHGLSLSQLHATGRTWVLTRLALRLTALPCLGEEVTVETWGSKRLRGARAYRDFRILNASEQSFCEGSSLWLLLDVTSRRPMRLPNAILAVRHPEWSTPEPVDATPLESPGPGSSEARLWVGWRDLDANGHANSVSYIEWALDTVPEHVRREKQLIRFDIQFLNEAFLGEEIVCAGEETGLPDSVSYRHSLRVSGGNLLVLARSDWR